MKKFFYFALLLLISSCAGGGSFQITGKLPGVISGDSVMIFSYANHMFKTPILASRVATEDDLIDFSTAVNEPQVAMFLKYKLNVNASYGVVFIEDGKVDIGFDEQRNSATFTGTPLNDIYENYRLSLDVIESKISAAQRDPLLSKEQLQSTLLAAESERAELIRKSVDANLDNLVGAYLFATEEFPKMEIRAASERLEQFSGQLKRYKFMREVAETIESKLRVEPGEEYFDISLLDENNKRHTLSDLLSEGKYVLVDFYVSRSPIYQQEVPYLQDAYAEFKGLGFEIYGVSLDTNRRNWVEMCEQLPWISVIRSSSSTITTDYAITDLPTNFLISPDGVIVAKDLRGEQVRAALEKCLR